MNKKIIVLGGDGFCGWPTSLRLSKEGYDVTIIDNLSKRRIERELGCESLTPIKPIMHRLEMWKYITHNQIKFRNMDISEEYQYLLETLKYFKPKTIIHFAEQPSAPYSMKNSKNKIFTVKNNLHATHNLLCAIVESGLNIHVIHLGTTGVYGYNETGMEIPEGYLPVKVEVDGKEKLLEIPYPAYPGSIYHMTKCQDAIFFYYYNKNDGVRITDLHQGIVWGTNTEETSLHESLINKFYYDGDLGTVLNRFLMQSAVDHPLTVHGTGGQTRAFIHIKDTVNCIKLAVENPPKKGERVKIFNQMTEVHTVRDLAKKISDLTGAKIRYYINPRKEDVENTLRIKNDGFLNLGLNPITLDDGLLLEVVEVAKKYKDRCDKNKIVCTSTWTEDMPIDIKGNKNEIIDA